MPYINALLWDQLHFFPSNTLPPRKADALGSDITKATNRLNFPFLAIIFTPPCRCQIHYHPFNLDILSSLFYPSCKKIKSNIVVCFQYPHKKYASKPLSNRSHTPITSSRNDNKRCKPKWCKSWMVCCFNVIGCVFHWLHHIEVTVDWPSRQAIFLLL